ncbi:MAG: hypothetical protein GF317_10160 [Candidatus Lokiarchaeota archaeon]|nr:hypothetical protein [Candidatus Lokiarchaeota archaeon]MBD3200023.1 hypothetical protein [Candidatus Lokiarchaeota archaeon]
METENENQKNKISVGLIITKDELFENKIVPNEIKDEIAEAPHYLLIFISREDVVKISCFPTETSDIKKILIKLEEFSPNLVKGISNILKELNLSKDILHTTGLCYQLQDCFYESYLIGDNIVHDRFENIKQSFMAIEKINNVKIEDVPHL